MISQNHHRGLIFSSRWRSVVSLLIYLGGGTDERVTGHDTFGVKVCV